MRIFLLLILVITCFSSCKKNELPEPETVDMRLRVEGNLGVDSLRIATTDNNAIARYYTTEHRDGRTYTFVINRYDEQKKLEASFEISVNNADQLTSNTWEDMKYTLGPGYRDYTYSAFFPDYDYSPGEVSIVYNDYRTQSTWYSIPCEQRMNMHYFKIFKAEEVWIDGKPYIRASVGFSVQLLEPGFNATVVLDHATAVVLFSI